jgi:DNA-binding GntR family transcriptional regulator
VTEPLRRVSVVDELADRRREGILDGSIAPGTPLRELELASSFAISRHTLRAALRELAAEGIVTIEPHRGARVAALDDEQLTGLFEVRIALEVEGARLALERNGGRLPPPVHDSLGRLAAATRRERPRWSAIARLHGELHTSLVAASGSSRLAAEYDRLSAELALFLLQLRPVWSLERMRTHHEELVSGLERDGTEVLRAHLLDGRDSILGLSYRPAAGSPRSSARPPV